MIIVKVQGNNVQENIDYLKYNGYGLIVIKCGDRYICLFGTKNYQDLGDVKVESVNTTFLLNYVSQSEIDYKKYI